MVNLVSAEYSSLTKPGIILGNLITALAGFSMASGGHFNAQLFWSVCFGLGLIIASACVFNNYIDRFSDAKMARTRGRPLARGVIAPWKAILFAILLGVLGFFVLGYYTNILTVSTAAVGFAIYVGFYSHLKTRSPYATLIGSFAGATPPIVGYFAVSDRIDIGALILFAMLVFWQMPHFFAIAIHRFDDYAAASIPVLPVSKGVFAAKVQSLLYCIAFTGTSLVPALFGYVGTAYLATASALGVAWIALSIRGFRVKDDRLWARSMFRLSLVVIIALSAVILTSCYVDAFM